MRQYKKLDRVVSLILICSLLLSLLSGCSNKPSETVPNVKPSESPVINTQEIAEDIISDLQVETLAYSTNWEDYVGDVETFVYGLMMKQMETDYDVFPSFVHLSGGTEVYGIAYTDYSECFTNEDNTEVVFSAGFISFPGEPELPQEDFDAGLFIEPLDYVDENTKFLFKFSSEECKDHCVAYNQYIIYGIDAKGQITYTAEEYVPKVCDESIGSLYSYDEGRYLYDVDFVGYNPLTGEALSSQIDYDALVAQINGYLKTQDANYAEVDIVTNLYFAQEAVVSYFLSLQEETFLGYDVDLLVDEANKLNPEECLQITSDGIEIIDISIIPSEGPAPLVKWLVGASCVVLTAAGIVGSMVFSVCPPLSSASGAVTGAAMDIFMQVVISNQALSDVDWTKVALAAVTGAVCGFLGPYIMATTSGAGYFFADSALDALMGGIEQTVSAWLDGADGKQMLKSFGLGIALGFGISAGFKGVGKVVELVGKGAGKLSNKIAPKLAGKVSSLAGKLDPITGKITSVLDDLKEAANKAGLQSEFITKKMANRQLLKLRNQGDEKALRDAIDQLTNATMRDANGNIITKQMLKEMFSEAGDGDVLAYIDFDGELVRVIKKNGLVGLQFDPSKYQSVTIDNMGPNREANMVAAVEKLKADWIKNPSRMPQAIKDIIDKSDKELTDVSGNWLKARIVEAGYTLHENLDLKTVTLVTRAIHDKTQGGLAHAGGVSLAKYLRAHLGINYFDRFLSAAASGLVASTN